MEVVSNAWKEAHQQMLLPETFVEIRLDRCDNEVTELAKVYNSESIRRASDLNKIVNRTVENEKMASLEHNLWMLDGSVNVFAEYDEGYTYPYPCVEMGLGDAGFTYVTRIVLSEVRERPIPGFTIIWSKTYNEYPRSFYVSVYRGGTEVMQTNITDNDSPVSDVFMDVSVPYDEIRIGHGNVRNWSFYSHRPKIEGVLFGGEDIVFDKNQILSYTHTQSGDLLSAELPQNVIEFSVDNSDGKWNMLNPYGFEKYLYEQMPITVRYGMDVNGSTEWINGGQFYLSEWRAPSNGLEAHFVARDVLEFLLNTPYHRQGSPTTIINGPAPVYTDTEMTELHGELESGTDVLIYESKSYWNNSHLPTRYRIGAGWLEGWYLKQRDFTWSELLSDAFAAAGLPSTASLNIDFEELAEHRCPYSMEATTAAEILQMCANAMMCKLWQSRDGTLNMQQNLPSLSDYVIPLSLSYNFPEVELVKPIRDVTVSQYPIHSNGTVTNIIRNVGGNGETIHVNNPVLVEEQDAIALADWLATEWKYREIVSGEFRADPRLDVFDVVQVESKYGTISPVVITDIKYTYNGSFHATYKGRRIGEESLS